MRLRVLSDLHLESCEWTPPESPADVIILAGDIHNGTSGLKWARRHFGSLPVIYVPGNHELFGRDPMDRLFTLRFGTHGNSPGNGGCRIEYDRLRRDPVRRGQTVTGRALARDSFLASSMVGTSAEEEFPRAYCRRYSLLTASCFNPSKVRIQSLQSV